MGQNMLKAKISKCNNQETINCRELNRTNLLSNPRNF